MKKETVLIALATLLLVSVSCRSGKTRPETDKEEWITLFNGQDLSDWTPKIRGYEAGDNFGNTFRVEDGMIKVRYDAYDTFDNRFGHLFFNEPFSNYLLRVEYRFVGHQCPGAPEWAYKNSGVMIHGQTPESMAIDQDFPASIEAQFLGSDSSVQRTTLNVCTPGTNIVIDNRLVPDHCTNSASGFFFDDEWVTAEIEVRGNEVIRHIVNGDTVLTYHQPQLDDREANFAVLERLNGGKMLRGGTISLQSEGHPIDFRKVELKRLP
ncbi:MAG TPA: DUF1080 domain-containing protein [Porphyromonadaceae bacterium]|jgi:hypothetical protein|nr:DUF1080 domain-containing protein [Porphyromonadaceae bacterium]HBL34917.1 DUF1080 domain-containing protein [Porphyromonadaceae bacterium]